jgi:hypothetical protein
MKKELQAKLLILEAIVTRCPSCCRNYEMAVAANEVIENHEHALQKLATEEAALNDDWSCTPYGEASFGTGWPDPIEPDGHLDKSILNQEEEYEEVIELHKTYGGD